MSGKPCPDCRNTPARTIPASAARCWWCEHARQAARRAADLIGGAADALVGADEARHAASRITGRLHHRDEVGGVISELLHPPAVPMPELRDVYEVLDVTFIVDGVVHLERSRPDVGDVCWYTFRRDGDGEPLWSFNAGDSHVCDRDGVRLDDSRARVLGWERRGAFRGD